MSQQGLSGSQVGGRRHVAKVVRSRQGKEVCISTRGLERVSEKDKGIQASGQRRRVDSEVPFVYAACHALRRESDIFHTFQGCRGDCHQLTPLQHVNEPAQEADEVFATALVGGYRYGWAAGVRRQGPVACSL